MCYTNKEVKGFRVRPGRKGDCMDQKTKRQIPPEKKISGTCENCEFYDYDEFDDSYSCRMSLDEDEMVEFLARQTRECPYFRFYDEYKSVHKQI